MYSKQSFSETEAGYLIFLPGEFLSGITWLFGQDVIECAWAESLQIYLLVVIPELVLLHLHSTR